MIYPFMTLKDDTEITYSEMQANGEVKVYIETPDKKDCFHSMVCYFPDYRVEEVVGYSEEEVEKCLDFIRKATHLIPCRKNMDYCVRKMPEMP